MSIKVPADAILDPKLGAPAFRLYCALIALSTDGLTVQVTGAQLADLLRKNPGSIWRSMDELRRRGYITRHLSPQGINGRYGTTPNLYIIHYPGGGPR